MTNLQLQLQIKALTFKGKLINDTSVFMLSLQIHVFEGLLRSAGAKYSTDILVEVANSPMAAISTALCRYSSPNGADLVRKRGVRLAIILQMYKMARSRVCVPQQLSNWSNLLVCTATCVFGVVLDCEKKKLCASPKAKGLLATETEASVVLLTAHHHPLLTEAMLGSVSKDMAEHCKSPVVILKGHAVDSVQESRGVVE
eukprot:1158887-Pelagomonas_calceolata.AAC.1